jgi:hypothetical protein
VCSRASRCACAHVSCTPTALVCVRYLIGDCNCSRAVLC